MREEARGRSFCFFDFYSPIEYFLFIKDTLAGFVPYYYLATLSQGVDSRLPGFYVMMVANRFSVVVLAPLHECPFTGEPKCGTVVAMEAYYAKFSKYRKQEH